MTWWMWLCLGMVLGPVLLFLFLCLLEKTGHSVSNSFDLDRRYPDDDDWDCSDRDEHDYDRVS